MKRIALTGLLFVYSLCAAGVTSEFRFDTVALGSLKIVDSVDPSAKYKFVGRDSILLNLNENISIAKEFNNNSLSQLTNDKNQLIIGPASNSTIKPYYVISLNPHDATIIITANFGTTSKATMIINMQLLMRLLSVNNQGNWGGTRNQNYQPIQFNDLKQMVSIKGGASGTVRGRNDVVLIAPSQVVSFDITLNNELQTNNLPSSQNIQITGIKVNGKAQDMSKLTPAITYFNPLVYSNGLIGSNYTANYAEYYPPLP